MKKSSRKIAFILIIAMTLGTLTFTIADAKDTRVRLGQATNGEGGKLTGCRAGDQSGSEVSLSKWGYSKGSSSPYHWVYVFRAKDPEVAKKMAATMKEIAKNNHVGYDKKMPDRCTLYDEAKKVNWDISKITRNCETTCASAVSVCINAAGIKVPRVWYSEIVYKGIMKTKQFYCYTSKDFTASSSKLLPGDVLVNPKKHTAMVVDSPNKFLYDIIYKGMSGKKETARVEEDKNLKINLNNGKTLESIKVNKKINLKNYEPEKKGGKFKGWKKTGDESFAAQYKSEKAPVGIENEIVNF